MGKRDENSALGAHYTVGTHQVLYTHAIPRISQKGKGPGSQPPFYIWETEA